MSSIGLKKIPMPFEVYETIATSGFGRWDPNPKAQNSPKASCNLVFGHRNASNMSPTQRLQCSSLLVMTDFPQRNYIGAFG